MIQTLQATLLPRFVKPPQSDQERRTSVAELKHRRTSRECRPFLWGSLISWLVIGVSLAALLAASIFIMANMARVLMDFASELTRYPNYDLIRVFLGY